MKRLFVVLAVVAATSTAYFLIRPVPPQGPWVRVRDVVIPVEIADTPALKTRGLSGRDSLAPDTGMLFFYDMPGPRAFWMKDMRFAVDIIWIGGDLTIAGITARAAPASYPATFSPAGDALHVLEVNAGFAERNDIVSGDPVELHLD